MAADKAEPIPSDAKNVAVVVVALSRFLATLHPTLPAHLASTLAGAEKAGLATADLELLRMLVRSLTP